MINIWFVAIFGSCLIGCTLAGSFGINVNTNGSYSIEVNGQTWLDSAPLFFIANGQRWSLADGTLKIIGTYKIDGLDSLGQWEKTCWYFYIDRYNIDTCFKQYRHPQLPFVVFEQIYHNATNNTAASNYDSVTAGFPAFRAPPKGQGKLGFLHPAGLMSGETDMNHGLWEEGARISTGLVGGPLVLFNKDDDVLIISPFNQFMAASSLFDGQNFTVGILGGVNLVPQDFVLQTILYYGDHGINEAMYDWGNSLKTYYGKDDSYRKSDLTINYLGYYTDNGAYYYYHTEDNKNYEQTFLNIRQSAFDFNVPYRYVQYDMYWYPKGPDGGSKTWVPIPEMFPHGFPYLYNKTGWPVAAHNRFWSSTTTYAKQNGGRFNFLMDKKMSVPMDETFWDYLLDTSRKWGLVMYEQDYLNKQFSGVTALLTHTDLARAWLMQMGEGARKNGMTVQYCMANPRHILQSVEIPVVTQARVSYDYTAGNDNWRIGVSSIMVDAVGIAPFKDNLWTYPDQPGNPKYVNRTEPHCFLELAVATLSTGPVGIGDMVNKTDVELLMQCCNANGLILKPSKAITAINDEIKKITFGSSVTGPRGEVWTTYSKIGEFYFGIVLGAAIEENYNLTPTKAGFESFLPSEIFTKYNGKSIVKKFTEANPLVITTACTSRAPCLYYTSPVLSPGGRNVLIYGEEGKIVPMSSNRITDITVDYDIKISLVGGAKEKLKFGFLLASDHYISISCQLGPSGTAVLSFNKQMCIGQ